MSGYWADEVLPTLRKTGSYEMPKKDKQKNIQEELRINGYQPVAGCAGTDMAEFFQGLMDRYKCKCSPFMLSMAYTYGVIQGKREERARKKNKKVGNYEGVLP